MGIFSVLHKLIVADFQSLDLIFGTDCPLCAINLKKLWCNYNCSPNQSDFLDIKNLTKVKVGNQYVDALETDLHISLNTTTNLYKSCRKIPEVSMMSSSAMGFLQFQGNHAADTGRMSIAMVFHDEEKGGFKPLIYNVYPCNTKVNNGDIEGYKNITTCSCNLYFLLEKRTQSCDLTCNGKKFDVFIPPGFFNGFGLSCYDRKIF